MRPTRLLMALGLAVALSSCSADNSSNPSGTSILKTAAVNEIAAGPAPGPGGGLEQYTTDQRFRISIYRHPVTGVILTAQTEYWIINGTDTTAYRIVDLMEESHQCVVEEYTKALDAHIGFQLQTTGAPNGANCYSN